MKAKSKNRGIESLKQKYGLMFVAPWILGIVLFVIIPVFTTFVYSISHVSIGAAGPEAEIIGFTHYYKLLAENTIFVDQLVSSITNIFTSLPIIIALSLILAYTQRSVQRPNDNAWNILSAGYNLFGSSYVGTKRYG